MSTELEARFHVRLEEVLQEAANPQPSMDLQARVARLVAAEPRPRLALLPGVVPDAPRSGSVLWGAALVDRGGGNRRGLWAAALAHASLVCLLVVLAARGVRMVTPAAVSDRTVTLAMPLPPRTPVALPAAAQLAGGGGGQTGARPVTRGELPRFAHEQLNPPRLDNAPRVPDALELPVTVEALPATQLAANGALGMFSAAPSAQLSLGNGRGTGLGAGSGAGVGMGVGGNRGGGVRAVGGGVSAPVVLYQPEPEFSDEARRAKVSGDVLIYLQVDESGRPDHVRVLRGLGMGLDEKAVEAVRRYRFRPAEVDGHPVRVEVQVLVEFHIL